MKKSTLFISTALTAFMLAITTSAVMAFQRLNAAPALAPAAVSLPVQQSELTPEQAAQVAATFMNRQDLYSVENAFLNGEIAYKVTFSSGDIVYLSTTGSVLTVDKLKVTVVPSGNIAQAPGSISQSTFSQPVQQSQPNFESEHEEHDD